MHCAVNAVNCKLYNVIDTVNSVLYTAISTLQCTLRAITLYLSKINNTPLHLSPLEVHRMCFAPGHIFVFVVMCMFNFSLSMCLPSAGALGVG